MSSEIGRERDYWNEDFDTYEQAVKRIYEINSKITNSPTPDYYEQAAQKIEAVDIPMTPQGYIG